MINKLLAAALLMFTSALFAAQMDMPILGSTDGDTIRSAVNLPCPLCRVSVRIAGIDTPEKGRLAKCAAEAALAVRASDALKQLIGTADVMAVKSMKWDKYGGRIVGQVFINNVDVGREMIERGLAVPYEGRAKPSWCS